MNTRYSLSHVVTLSSAEDIVNGDKRIRSLQFTDPKGVVLTVEGEAHALPSLHASDVGKRYQVAITAFEEVGK